MTQAKETESNPEAIRPITSILIADRGEMALRILEACHELNIGASVAVSLADVDSLAARRARELAQEDPRYSISIIGGPAPSQSYQNVKKLIEFAQIRGCDAIHPGYGMIAEKAEIAQQIVDAGVRYIGPTPFAMNQLGDKTNGKKLAQQLDVPVIAGSGNLKTLEEAEKAFAAIEGTAMLKTPDGGGGRGIRRVETIEQLREQYDNLTSTSSEVFIEKAWNKPRHIEFQFLGDTHGNGAVVGAPRDCSVQRRRQKIIEETPAVGLPEEIEEKMKADVVLLGKAVGYEGAGTAEFLFDPTTNDYGFMEWNPRLQVEHTITEELVGVDLVKAQIRITEGYALPKFPAPKNIFVRQYRVYAESETGAPAGGTIEVMDEPKIEGVRVDRGYVAGQKVPAIYDLTVKKIIVTGKNRDEVNKKGDEALEKDVTTGVPTNLGRLREINSRPAFREGPVYTTFVEEVEPRERPGGLPKHIAEFIGGNPENFEEFPMPVRLDPEKLLYQSQYEKDGKQRIYKDEMAQAHKEHPTTCAFRFGQVTDSGFQYMLGFFDFERFGGSMGVEEGNAIVAFLEEANKRKQPAILQIFTGGARQQEGVLALIQMAYTLAGQSVNKDIPLLMTWYYKFACGGVNASIAERAHIKGAVGEDTIVALTGPDIVAKTMGLRDRRQLPTGALTARTLYMERLLDFVVGTMSDARRKTLDILASEKIPASIVSPNPHFPTLEMRPFEAVSTRFDQPKNRMFPTIFAHGLADLPAVFRRASPHEKIIVDETRPLSVDERVQHIEDPHRPTPIDFMRPDIGIFQNVVPMFVQRVTGPVFQIPVVCPYLAEYRGVRVVVLAQQTQLKLEGKKLKKEYVPPGVRDIELALRWVDNAEKMGRHIILFGDTEGADVKLDDSAYRGITDYISRFILRIIEARVAVASVNTGKGGSGGGLMHIVPADAAADLALTHVEVAGSAVHHRINTNDWPNQEQLVALRNQLLDGTAEGRINMFQSDYKIYEPLDPDPKKAAEGMKYFFDKYFLPAMQMPPQERFERRIGRYKKAATFATIPLEKAGVVFRG